MEFFWDVRTCSFGLPGSRRRLVSDTFQPDCYTAAVGVLSKCWCAVAAPSRRRRATECRRVLEPCVPARRPPGSCPRTSPAPAGNAAHASRRRPVRRPHAHRRRSQSSGRHARRPGRPALASRGAAAPGPLAGAVGPAWGSQAPRSPCGPIRAGTGPGATEGPPATKVWSKKPSVSASSMTVTLSVSTSASSSPRATASPATAAVK